MQHKCPLCSFEMDFDDITWHLVYHWLMPAQITEDAQSNLEIETGSLIGTLEQALEPDWDIQDIIDWLDAELPIHDDKLIFLLPTGVSDQITKGYDYIHKLRGHIFVMRDFLFPGTMAK